MQENSLRMREWRERHKKMCPTCKKQRILPESKQCWDCSHGPRVLKSTTIGEYRHRLSVKGKHPSWLNAHIRQFARTWNKKLTQNGCENCNYSLHVELAHKIPISEFKDDQTLGEVNSPQNLKALCPNCHWEYDNGYL